jgi:hypothetical protein
MIIVQSMENRQLDTSCKTLRGLLRDSSDDVESGHHMLLAFTHAFPQSEKHKKTRQNGGGSEFLESIAIWFD